MDWKPTPKQIQALQSDAFEVLLGGARGGGKTDAGLAWFLYMAPFPEARGLCIRRNATDLVDWVDRARMFYARQKAEVKGNPPEVHFPTGAIIRTGHLNDENAYEKYQGHEYHRMLIEELTQIPREDSYQKLIASCRSSSPRLHPQIFATTNPGGPGHKWVQQRFRLVGTPREPVIFEAAGRKRAFYPATITDNPHLLATDPHYAQMLDDLPDGLREAWRDGSWDSFHVEGAIFEKELQQARTEHRITNVPHEPSERVITFWDLGMGDYTAILCVQLIGREVRIIETYQNQNEALPHYVQYLNQRRYTYGTDYLPHDVEVRELSTGSTRKQMLESLGRQVSVMERDNDVGDALTAVRILFPRLWVDQVKCADFIDAISQYRFDWSEKLGRFHDKPLHDFTSHYADALRGLAVSLKRIEAKPSTQELWKIQQNRKRGPRFR